MAEQRPPEIDLVTDRMAMETIFGELETLESPYRFIHCARCVQDHPRGDVSMREWMRLEIGLTPTGFLIRCVRHDMPVTHLTPEAMKRIVELHQPCGHPGCGHDHG